SEVGKCFGRAVGTPRGPHGAGALGRDRLGGRPAEMLVFDGPSPSRELAAAISQADALLISAAPAEGRDPVLAVFEDEIAQAPRLGAVVYLSSLGVYGDSGGAWVGGDAEDIPGIARRGCTHHGAGLHRPGPAGRHN